ncbi:MAG: hypothetical protein AAF686_05105, partial [Pseudomonadota bacterium]
ISGIICEDASESAVFSSASSVLAEYGFTTGCTGAGTPRETGFTAFTAADFASVLEDARTLLDRLCDALGSAMIGALL